MGMEYEDYEGLLKIDKDDLDGELERNPKTFLDVSNEFARAVSRRDQLKDDLKVVEAKLQLRVREESSEKLTEALAKAMVEAHPRRKKAVRRYLRACEEAQRWENLKDSLKDRGFALRELGNLYVSGYWGGTSVRGNRHEVEEKLYQDRRRIISQEKRRRGQRGYRD